MKKLFYLSLVSLFVVFFSFCSTKKDVSDKNSSQTGDSFDSMLALEQPKEPVSEQIQNNVQEKEQSKESVSEKKEVITEARIQGLTFDFDSAKLLEKKHKALLTQMKKDLTELKPVELIIEGYCDERGSDEYNDKLGLKRADSVGKYIKNNTDYSSKLVSYGKRKPVVRNAQKIKDKREREKAHAKNRRVEILAKFDY